MDKRVSFLVDRIYEPAHETTNNLGFRPGPTQTGLYSHKNRLVAGNFGFKKKRECKIRVVTAQLICAFVFAYVDCCFSHAAAHIFSVVLFLECFFSRVDLLYVP